MPLELWYSVLYEGYGPGESAVIVDCRIDDRERTRVQLRHAFSSHGGRLGATGSVAYLFKEVGLLEFPPAARSESFAALAWQAGAEEVVVNRKGSVEVLTDPVELEAVRAALAQAGHSAVKSERTCRAAAAVKLAGATAVEMWGLFRALAAVEGVQAIYTNAEIAGEVLAKV
jgi:transcriptional/translational regulatory protein YebC/TACO1